MKEGIILVERRAHLTISMQFAYGLGLEMVGCFNICKDGFKILICRFSDCYVRGGTVGYARCQKQFLAARLNVHYTTLLQLLPLAETHRLVASELCLVWDLGFSEKGD